MIQYVVKKDNKYLTDSRTKIFGTISPTNATRFNNLEVRSLAKDLGATVKPVAKDIDGEWVEIKPNNLTMGV